MYKDRERDNSPPSKDRVKKERKQARKNAGRFKTSEESPDLTSDDRTYLRLFGRMNGSTGFFRMGGRGLGTGAAED